MIFVVVSLSHLLIKIIPGFNKTGISHPPLIHRIRPLFDTPSR
jgi:hypothetical protein